MSRTLLLACSLSFVACAPKRDLSIDQINAVTKLDELMDAQATLADPQWKKRTQPSFTDAEWATFADISTRLQATALKTKAFSKGPGFDELATRLHDESAALGVAAQSKDADGARKALVAMKSTCRECHSKFK